MSEGIPTRSEKEPTKKEKIIALAVELNERREIFPFSGIDQESYSKNKSRRGGDARLRNSHR